MYYKFHATGRDSLIDASFLVVMREGHWISYLFFIVVMKEALVLFIVSATIASPAYSQPGFISLDCGASEKYTDDDTGIEWIPDDAYINSGHKSNISNTNSGGAVSRQLNTLRSFPEKRKSCYQLPVEIGKKYLLRGTFVYGNYDSLNSPPHFALILDADLWDSVSFSDSSPFVVQKEIIFMAKFYPTNLCLARMNDSSGMPIISSLELRPLNQSMYWPVSQDHSLLALERTNFGAKPANSIIRYPSDLFDRLWSASVEEFPPIKIEKNVSIGTAYDQPPSLVMQTAQRSNLSSSSRIDFPLMVNRQIGYLYIAMYFAELRSNLKASAIREFDLTLDDNKLNNASLQPKYLQSSNISTLIPYGITTTMQFRLLATNRSTLPPIANALELYRQSAQRQQGTFVPDLEALTIIQQQLNYTYVGDPCLPSSYSWDWLICNDDTLPRIISLNLSNKRLTGSIPANISSLTALEIIDLSDNNLSGSIPESMASLKNLKELNLKKNNLMGIVPETLLNNKNLNLSLSGNVHLCERSENNCKSSSKKKGLIIGLATSGGIVLAILSCAATLIIWKKYKSSEGETTLNSVVPNDLVAPRSRVYSYEEVREMTSEFSRQIGRGGYGPVFYGKLDNGPEVAVKVCSATSKQGSREFTTEVALLSRVHHKNLVNLLGYCCEDEHRILIYEFVSKGNLNQLLHGSSASKNCLDWDTRLDIALNAAQGLEYLHAGCKPQIIHRDIKSANILLSEKMEAKVADFGLSREGPASEATHVSTNVKGTFGYLDPQYTKTNNLTEKSDVYSFGVVILEIISGRKPIDTDISEEHSHIISWAKSLISQGRIESLIDSKGGQHIELSVMWKIAELALLCTESKLNKRPTMSEVVIELKEAIRLLHTTDNSGCGLVKDDSFALQFSLATDGNSLPSPR